MVRKYFAAAAIVLFLTFVAVALDNYNQEWRQWQRAYLTELKLREKGSLSLWDRLQVELSMDLNRVKIVTEPGRLADMCLACHANTGVPGFEANPLKDLNEIHENLFILQEMPLDQVGCTACHGGDPLALTTERAHENMLSRFEELFLESLEQLRSPKQMERQRGIERIRWMTGTDFGFVFSDPPEVREAKIREIEAWWERHRDTFLAEGYGERDSPFKTENPQREKILQETTVSPIGENLQFVGSNTCVACHSNPQLGGTSYIPFSNKEHVERWFRDEFKTSENPEMYLYNHPWLAEVLAAQVITDPERRREVLELIDEARRTGKVPQPPPQELIEAMRSLDITCEACHGPGSEYAQLMMRGMAFEFQGRSDEATQLIARGAEIARENAQRNVSDSSIWRIFERLIARLTGSDPESQLPSEPESESQE